MLIEFRVKNFLSFKEQVTFSLLASNPDSKLDKEYPENIFETSYPNIKLLRSAVVYGANASGKTNLFLAMQFAQKLILTSHALNPESLLHSHPFSLDENSRESPTSFDFVFIHENLRYTYGFSIARGKIAEEYLYAYPKNRKKIFFERFEESKYRFIKNKKKQKEISEKTRNNSLYLSVAAQWNYEDASKPFEWFNNILKSVIKRDDDIKDQFFFYTARLSYENQKIKNFIEQNLKKADIGIESFDIKIADSQSTEKIYQKFPPSLQAILKDPNNQLQAFQVKMLHKAINSEGKEFATSLDISQESSGTEKFFACLGPWIDVLMNGYVLFIDELDTRLHPMLTQYLIEMFHNPEINRKNAQLLFNTYNTHLLSADILRRDQVWFTEKRKDGSTDLYSLLEYSPRKSENLEKGYLQGRYGAIPCLGGPFSWD